MPRPTGDVQTGMPMFRWIVNLIRDEYEVDEAILRRSAVPGSISQGFQVRLPAGTLDEAVKLRSSKCARRSPLPISRDGAER